MCSASKCEQTRGKGKCKSDDNEISNKIKGKSEKQQVNEMRVTKPSEPVNNVIEIPKSKKRKTKTKNSN